MNSQDEGVNLSADRGEPVVVRDESSELYSPASAKHSPTWVAATFSALSTATMQTPRKVLMNRLRRNIPPENPR